MWENPFAILGISNLEAQILRHTHQIAANASQADLLAQKMAEITSHPYLKYTHSNRTLVSTLDFTATHSPLQQAELAKSLNEILPKYSDHAANIYIDISFRAAHMDLIDNNNNAYRHCILANMVYELNKFRQLDSVRVAVSVPEFHWGQFQPVSAVYGLDYKKWSFEVTEQGHGTRTVELGSSLDRRLAERFWYEI